MANPIFYINKQHCDSIETWYAINYLSPLATISDLLLIFDLVMLILELESECNVN